MEKATIEQLFLHLGDGSHEAFFERVAEDVDWTVMGTHPLAGTYHSKAEFQQGTTERLAALMRNDRLPLRLEHLWLDGQTAIAEMSAQTKTKTGKTFRNRYCWVCRFERNLIVEVRAYLDSVAVKEVIFKSG